MDNHTNFAYGTVLTAPSPATSGTSLVLNSGQGAQMPTPPFNAVIWPTGVIPTAANAEIVRVTALTSDTFTTMTRGQEGSTARTVVVGDQVAVAVTAKTLTDIETVASAAAVKANNLSDLASASIARTNLGVDTVANAHIYDTEANIFALSASTYSGYLAYATDTYVLFRSNGSLWKPIMWPWAPPSGLLPGLSNIALQSVTSNTIALVASGSDTLEGIFIPRGFIVNNIKWRTGGTGATFGSNADEHWYLVIRKQDGSLMASTADQGTASIASSQNKSIAIARDSANGAASTWTSPASDYYLAGPNVYIGTGGAPVMPNSCGSTALSGTGQNGIGKIIAGTGQTGMTSGIPATAPGTPANGTIQVWVGVN